MKEDSVLGNGLVTIKQACEQFGVSDFTLRKWIRSGELMAFVNPLDRRARLLDVDELTRYAAPRRLPTPTPREEVPA